MLIGIAAAALLIVGPLLLGLRGVMRPHRAQRDELQRGARCNWRLTANSAFLYAIAFNLTFFIQELFLVLPKALLPGVTPTLFHNNHTWEGDHPLTRLFQGSGALATFASGLLCALLLRHRPPASRTWRLFLIWMTYSGLLQALPQVVVGALYPGNDVGMAMDYLGLLPWAKTAAALSALLAIPVIALQLTPALLALADRPAQIESARARSAFIFGVATLPALLAILLIVPFRMPREWLEVLAPPIVVTVIGVAWMQAGAWRLHAARPDAHRPLASPLYPLLALLALLLVFQLLLRPGIRF
jgi:hypothetical protein